MHQQRYGTPRCAAPATSYDGRRRGLVAELIRVGVTIAQGWRCLDSRWRCDAASVLRIRRRVGGRARGGQGPEQWRGRRVRITTGACRVAKKQRVVEHIEEHDDEAQAKEARVVDDACLGLVILVGDVERRGVCDMLAERQVELFRDAGDTVDYARHA